MTRDEIISMAREPFEAEMRRRNPCVRFARQSDALGGNYRTVSVQRAWQMWQRAMEVEREACAKVCEAMHEEDRPGDYAYAIRARGQA